MGGQIQYVYWDGARLTPWMKYQLERLDADLRRIFGVHLVFDPSKGIRLNEDQRRIFLSRYRPQSSGNGPYGDVRWWNGRRYVRHSGLGTVAQPGSSNHEIQGTTAAVDLADSGGAGIGTWGSERSNWLRKNAANYGLIPEGFNFGEAWHYAMPNIFRKPPTQAATGNNVTPAVTEEDDMKLIRWTRNGGVWLVGDGKCAHVKSKAELDILVDRYGAYQNVEDGGMSLYQEMLAIPFSAFDATYNNKAHKPDGSTGGRYWSREMAEGIAGRTNDTSLAQSIEQLAKNAPKH